MFFKLAMRNSRRSRKENGLFFASLVVSIVAFYIILALSHQDVMIFLRSLESDAVNSLLQIAAVFYVFSLVMLFFLIYYASKYQLERRRHELGMYIMMGMRRSKLFALLMAEDLGSSVVALLIGLPIAILVSERAGQKCRGGPHQAKGAGTMKKQLDIKKLLILNLPYLLMGLFATNFGEAWRMVQGADASQKALSLISVLPVALASWWPSLHPLDLLVGLCCGAGLRLAVYLKSKNAKKYRHGMEYGSARWGTHEDIAPYVDPVFQNNVILTKTESLTMNSRPKDPKTARNKNVLVIGGSGSGKTRFWLKPNLMQMHSSYVVTDPKGTILVECGKMLQRGAPKLGKDGKPMKDKHGKVINEPYRIKVLNTINFKKSMHYNPFAYIHSEKDILKLVTTLIANTKGEGKAGDDFWVKAETLLYCALIGYIHYEAPVEEQNFSTLIEFINAMEVREDDEEFKNPVDLMFDALEAEKPNHFAVRQYKKYKLAAGKTAKSILISCGARLAVFDIAELREVTAYDELELDTLGDRKTALFLIMSDTDDSFNFLISMCYTQLFNLLCEKADDVYGGRLPVHVRCLIDECANIGQIPKLEKLVATIRSREISACLVLQAQSQLKAIYKDNADTIIGNMDTSIFLGGKEPTTLKELAAVLGKETIDTYNTGESRGRETSHSLNYQKLGKDMPYLFVKSSVALNLS